MDYINNAGHNIRVFISSTFNDLQDERDYLVKHVFPELRILSENRGASFTEIDLRWGITEDEAKEGKVIDICFQEIENSIPFFIGIIGERYGWCPESHEIDSRIMDKYDFLERFLERRMSITEMEIQYGVLERQERINACFFISKNLPPNNELPQKLILLKNKIEHNVHNYPIHYFSTKEELGEQTKSFFTNLIDQLFPQGGQSFYDREKCKQYSFINKLREIYIPPQTGGTDITQWVTCSKEKCLMISGERGIGKSSLLANWVYNNLNNDSFELIFHFIGCDGLFESYESFSEILAKDICLKFQIPIKDCEDNYLQYAFTHLPSERKQLVIVLDAINQIEEKEHRYINWISSIPVGVKIIFSTIEEDISYSIGRHREYSLLRLSPLTNEKRRQMIIQYLGRSAKRLLKPQINAIISEPLFSNTLALTTFLNELIKYGQYEHLSEKIKRYIGLQSVEEFYSLILQDYENEFGAIIIKDILCLLYISEKGLTESELIDITGIRPIIWSQFFCSFRRNLIITDGRIVFAHEHIYRAVSNNYLFNENKTKYHKRLLEYFLTRPSFRAKSEVMYQSHSLDNADILFEHIKEIPNFIYLNSSSGFQSIRKYWNYLINKKNPKYSLDIYLKAPTQKNDYSTLAYMYNQMGYLINDSFSDYPLAIKYYQQSIKYLSKCSLGRSSIEVGIRYNNMATSYMNMSMDKMAINLYRKSLKIRTDTYGEFHPDVATSLNNIGSAYISIDLNEAKKYHERALAIRYEIYGFYHKDVSISCANLSTVMRHLGYYETAEKYALNAIDIVKKLYSDQDEDLPLYYGLLAANYASQAKYELAEKYYLLTINIINSRYISAHSLHASLYCSLGRLYVDWHKYELGLKYLNLSLSTYKQLNSEGELKIADLMYEFANYYRVIGDNKKSEYYYLKTLNLYKKYGVERYVTICNDIGYYYYSIGKHDKAIKYYHLCLEYIMKNFPDDLGSVALEKNNIARALFMKEELNSSLELQMEALKIQISYYGENNLNTARSYNNIGLIYLSLKDYEKALVFLNKGLDIRKLLNEEADIANSLSNIGDYWIKLNNIEKSLDSYQSALDIYTHLYGKEDSLCREMQKKLNSVTKK